MKKLLLLLTTLSALTAVAQPTVNNVTVPIGDSAIVRIFDEYPLTGFPTSGNHTWDFSAIPYSSYVDSVKYRLISPTATPFATDFPTATFCMNVEFTEDGTPFNLYHYVRNTTDSFWSLGTKSPTSTFEDEIYDNPQVLYKFPFILNNVQSDFYSFTSGDTGSTRTKYVGWGNIKTPFGTYNNVVLFEEYYYNSETSTWDVDYYRWVSAATLNEIFHYYAESEDGEIYDWSSATTSIAQEDLAKKYELSIYPNPSKNISYISFQLKEKTDLQIQLISVDGRVSKNILTDKLQAGTHQIPFSANELANGTYFIRILFGNNAYATTIVVEK